MMRRVTSTPSSLVNKLKSPRTASPRSRSQGSGASPSSSEKIRDRSPVRVVCRSQNDFELAVLWADFGT